LYSLFWVIPRHLYFMCRLSGRIPAHTTYEDGTDSVFQNVGTKNTEAGESPKIKNTTFRTRRKFEIENNSLVII
jgi:hypothetical protein